MQDFDYTGTDTLEVMEEAKKYNDFLESLVIRQLKSADKVVDMGAGIGTFAKSVTARGYNVHCVEIDKRQAQLIEQMGLPVSTNAGELADNSVDVIYSLNVLEHIEHDAEALAEWKTKLKPGGKMIIYVPAFQCLYSSMDKKVEHFRRYRRKMLKKLMQQEDMEILTLKYADSIGFFAALVYKLFDKGDGAINKKPLVFYDRIVFPLSRIGDFFFSRLFGKNVYVVARKRTQ